MIRSYGDRDTEQLFLRQRSRRWQSIERAARRKLLMLDAAGQIDDLRAFPGNRLEKLSGNLRGFWSIRINDQFRITFRYEDGDAHDVQIVDYH